MAKRPIQNPHDSFFKQTFGSVDFTRSFLSQYMASDVVRCLDLSSLEAAPESSVDDELRQSHSDLVFTVGQVGGGQAVVYLLFEHKSHPDPLTVFQLLKYILRDDLPGELDRIFTLFAAIRQQPRGLDCIKLLLRYVIQGTDRVPSHALRKAIETALPLEGKTLMPTLAEQWTREGREKGLQEGREEGELIGQIRAFQEILGLPVATQETLLESNAEQLRAQLAELRARLWRS